MRAQVCGVLADTLGAGAEDGLLDGVGLAGLACRRRLHAAWGGPHVACRGKYAAMFERALGFALVTRHHRASLSSVLASRSASRAISPRSSSASWRAAASRRCSFLGQRTHRASPRSYPKRQETTAPTAGQPAPSQFSPVPAEELHPSQVRGSASALSGRGWNSGAVRRPGMPAEWANRVVIAGSGLRAHGAATTHSRTHAGPSPSRATRPAISADATSCPFSSGRGGKDWIRCESYNGKVPFTPRGTPSHTA